MSDSAFAALKGGNFRLGTLAYYRGIEDGTRRDPGEGPAPVHFEAADGDSRVIEAEEFNRASGAVGGFMKMNSPFKLRIRGSGKFIMDTALNVFVFCSTIEDHPNPGLDAKFGDKKIQIPDPDAFSRAVAHKLVEEVINAGKVRVNETANSISHGHHSVVYQPKPALKPEDVTDSRIDLTQVFLKEPATYEDESEYRFVWFPEDNRTKKLCFLPLNLQYLDLDFPGVWDFIQEA